MAYIGKINSSQKGGEVSDIVHRGFKNLSLIRATLSRSLWASHALALNRRILVACGNEMLLNHFDKLCLNARETVDFD